MSTNKDPARRSIVDRCGPVSDRDSRTAAFVRRRFGTWLGGALEAACKARNDLAEALASDPEDVQTWPRYRIKGWLEGSITVSTPGAFAAGEALTKLGVPTCGPQTLFVAGHVPQFIGLLEYLADDAACWPLLSSIAVLPFVAYAIELAPSQRDEVEGFRFHADAAKEILRRATWPHDAFARAFDDFAKKAPLRREHTGLSMKITTWHLKQAYILAADAALDPDDAIEYAFPHVADWVATIAPWHEGLEELATAYEDACTQRRRAFRRFLQSRKDTP